MIDRVGYTGVLGYALIREINLAFCIQSNVLKQSVAFDRIVDVGFGLLVQVDNLSVAAALSLPKISFPAVRFGYPEKSAFQFAINAATPNTP